jgi:hypothetical protein
MSDQKDWAEAKVLAHTPAKYHQRKASGAHELYDKDANLLYKVDRDMIRYVLDGHISYETYRGGATINRQALEDSLIQYCADIRNGKVPTLPTHDDQGPG